jgi:hypothetical protein
MHKLIEMGHRLSSAASGGNQPPQARDLAASPVPPPVLSSDERFTLPQGFFNGVCAHQFPLDPGNFPLDVLTAFSGNAIRTYGSDMLSGPFLDRCAALNVRVIAGLWIDRAALQSGEEERLTQQLIQDVRKWRGYRAIVGWSIGNEIELRTPFSGGRAASAVGSAANAVGSAGQRVARTLFGFLPFNDVVTAGSHALRRTFGSESGSRSLAEGDETQLMISCYELIERIAIRIKAEDPSRMTTTAIVDVGTNKASLFARHCPHVDVLGINTYTGEED